MTALRARPSLRTVPRALALSWGHYGPSDEGISSVRPHNTAVARGPACDARTPPSQVPRAGCSESEQARAETQGQNTRFFFRPRRELIPLRRADERLIGQALADDAADGRAEAVGVVHVLPVIVAEGLLIQILSSFESLVRQQFIGVERRSSLDVLVDFSLKRFLLPVADDGGVDLPAAFVLHGEPDSLEHEPRGFLRHADGSVNLPRADTILAVGNLPDGRQPLIQAERAILEDGTGLERELPARVSGLTDPAYAKVAGG